jgi:hypothetical protein
MLLPRSAPTALAVSWLGLAGCSGTGRFLREVFRERPPVALDSMSVASDARVDSMGYVVGSFVGEGTSRAVHLLSSDTGFIAALVRRYRPAIERDGDLWRGLARERVVSLAPGGLRRTTGTPLFDRAMVGGPAGHTAVTPTAIRLHGSACGPRGTQAEIIVEGDHRAQQPDLRGPVLGSLTHSQPAGSATGSRQSFRRRDPAPEPGTALLDELLARTGRVMDSTLGSQLRSLRLRRADDARLEINTLADVDAADVIPFRPSSGAVRYAVSLRSRRITEGGDTVLAATVMVWDSAGAWQQVIFRPTLVSLRRGRLAPYGAFRRGLIWRRLQPISDVAFERDNLWMEQVDVRDGTVLWGIIQPRGNVVVAAAQLEGPCQ